MSTQTKTVQIFRRRQSTTDVRAVRWPGGSAAGMLDNLAHEFGYASAQVRNGMAVLRPWGHNPVPTLPVYPHDWLVADPDSPALPLRVMSGERFAELYESAGYIDV